MGVIHKAMVSAVDMAKRALITVLRLLATAYGCVGVAVTRDSDDAAVRRAYRQVSRRVHPDRPGGSEEDQKKLNAANDAWCEAQREKVPRGRPARGKGREARQQGTPAEGLAAHVPSGSSTRAGFRINAAAVLLTYQGFEGVQQWERFLVFIGGVTTERVGRAEKCWAARMDRGMWGRVGRVGGNHM